jgi:hypothetical protein
MIASSRQQKKPTTDGDVPPYETATIEPAEPPEGGIGKNWFRYTITQGRNTITGYRRGTMRTVKRDVNAIVVELNERRSGRRGRVHLTSPSRKKS